MLVSEFITLLQTQDQEATLVVWDADAKPQPAVRDFVPSDLLPLQLGLGEGNSVLWVEPHTGRAHCEAARPGVCLGGLSSSAATDACETATDRTYLDADQRLAGLRRNSDDYMQVAAQRNGVAGWSLAVNAGYLALLTALTLDECPTEDHPIAWLAELGAFRLAMTYADAMLAASFARNYYQLPEVTDESVAATIDWARRARKAAGFGND